MASKMDVKANLVAKLARFLRLNGESVMKGSCKLSLTTSALSLINSVFVDLLVHDEVDSGSTSDDSASQGFLEDAQFLLDFIKKTKFLKLFHGIQTLRGGVNVSYFKGITALELKKIPAHLIVGLNTLPRLKSLTCNRSLASLKELLGPYTDDAQHEDIWLELTELNVSCNYLESLDSLRAVPNVEVVDASQNNLKHVYELMVLDKLIILKLNYNMLQNIPLLNQYSTFTLKVLLMRNNNVEDLAGLEMLKSLEELDISYNCISEYNSLKPIQTLKFLKNLQLENNPVSQSKQYTELIMPYFHDNIALKGIILDGKKLSPKDIQSHVSKMSTVDYASGQQTSIIAIMEDKENIGTRPFGEFRHAPPYEKTEIISKYNVVSEDSDPSLPRNHDDTTKGGIQSRRKASKKFIKKQREAVILQPDNTADENVPGSTAVKGFQKDFNIPSHLITKKLIEARRKEYGSEWLIPSHSFQTLIIDDKAQCILENSPASSDTSYLDNHQSEHPESPVEHAESQMGESHASSSQDDSMNVQVGELDTLPLEDDSSTMKLKIRKHSVVSDDIQVLEPGSYDQAFKNLVIDTQKNISDLTVTEIQEKEEDSSDESNIEDDVIVSDSEEDCEDRIFVVERKDERKCRPVFVCIGQKCIKEKFFKTGRLSDVLDLSRLLSIRLNDVIIAGTQKFEVVLSFDILQINKEKRIYIFDDIQYAKKMVAILQPFADAKAFEDATVGALQCLRCRSEFSRNVAHLKVQTKRKLPAGTGHLSSGYDSSTDAVVEADICPNCGSSLVVELEKMPLPSAASPIPLERGHLSVSKESLNSSSPVLGQLSSMLYSMIKHPKTGREISVPMSTTPKEKQCAMNSGELPADQSMRNRAGLSFVTELDENENKGVSSSAADVSSKLETSSQNCSTHSSDLTIPSQRSSIGVISSDSEGDMTLERESICSPAVISPPLQLEFAGDPTVSDADDIIPPCVPGSPSGHVSVEDYYECKESFCENVEKSVEESTRILAMMAEVECLGFEGLANVDHSVRLFIEFTLLGKDEELDACLEADIVHPEKKADFHGLLVFSSKRIYIMKLMSEVYEDIGQCIQKMASFPLTQLRVIRILVGSQSFVTVLGSDKVYYFIAADSDHCNHFICSLKEKLNCRLGYMPNIENPVKEDFKQIECDILNKYFDPPGDVEKVLEEAFYKFVFWKDHCGKQDLERVALLITPQSLFIASIGFSRHVTRRHYTQEISLLQYTPLAMQRIMDVVEIQIEENLRDARLNFLNDSGEESAWRITTKSKSTLNCVINYIKCHWENLFRIILPLKLFKDSENS